jgi:hypothetical protein
MPALDCPGQEGSSCQLRICQDALDQTHVQTCYLCAVGHNTLCATCENRPGVMKGWLHWCRCQIHTTMLC